MGNEDKLMYTLETNNSEAAIGATMSQRVYQLVFFQEFSIFKGSIVLLRKRLAPLLRL